MDLEKYWIIKCILCANTLIVLMYFVKNKNIILKTAMEQEVHWKYLKIKQLNKDKYI